MRMGTEISRTIWEIGFSNSMKSEWEILQIVSRGEESLVAVLGEILRKLQSRLMTWEIKKAGVWKEVFQTMFLLKKYLLWKIIK